MDRPNGFFGIGIEGVKNDKNIGLLWRSASILGASFIFTIGKRYKKHYSDTTSAEKNIPLYDYETFDDFHRNLPIGAQVVAVEITEKSTEVHGFIHPKTCVYLLGSEDNGLSKQAKEKSHLHVQLPGNTPFNVAIAGSIIMYDRINKLNIKAENKSYSLLKNSKTYIKNH